VPFSPTFGTKCGTGFDTGIPALDFVSKQLLDNEGYLWYNIHIVAPRNACPWRGDG